MVKNIKLNGLMCVARVWLADYGEDCRARRRFFPRVSRVGETAKDEVWLVEVPFAVGDRRIRRWLAKWIRHQEGREGGKLRLGMPLGLAKELANEYPQVLAAGRSVACREFVRNLGRQRGGLAGLEVGVLNLAEIWQYELVECLVGAGAKVMVCGPVAKRLAAERWQQGVALPVVSARKMLAVCNVVVVMQGVGQGVLAEASDSRVVMFAEPLVYVPGRFVGKYMYGMFPAGQLPALQEQAICCVSE